MSLLDNLFAKTDHSQQTTTTEPENKVNDSTVNPIAQHDKSVLSHLDTRSTEAISNAFAETKRKKIPLIEPKELLFGLLSDREVFKMLQEFSVDVAALTRELQGSDPPGSFTGEPTLSEQSKQILEDAYNSTKTRNVEFITPEDILLAMFAKSPDIAEKLNAKGVDKAKVEEKLSKSQDYKTGGKSVLSKYGVDLTEKAKKGELDPVTGRDVEIQRLIHILLRRTKNNPIIIGEAGVGKTAIVEGLAQMIAQQKVSPDLAQRRIIQLDISSLVAGASHRGEFEERLQSVIKETMASQGQIILFIDEIHNLMGAGGSDGTLDASNILKPYLSRGQLQIIGTTTTAEYRKHFEKDRAFERRFQPVMAPEPDEETAVKMIEILQPKYEAFHKVTFSPEALKSSVHLSKRYVGERSLPDKAIDLLDESAAEVRLDVANGKRQDNVVKNTDIEKIVSRWTGVPITRLTEKESEKLLHLEELIHQKFINHERAVSAVAEAVRRGRIGLANANRPIASFIFLGPTGTGKTELSKVLAEIMFGKPDAMIRLDMSEYMEKHEVAKLVGAPPGYVGYEEGGQLTEAVRNKPYSIVLLDEIEKAHPDVFNILLQLLEDGRLTDNKGNTISFKNTVIIATSNVGSEAIRSKLSQRPSEAKPAQSAPTPTPATPSYDPAYPASIPAAAQPPQPAQAQTAAEPTTAQPPTSQNNLIQDPNQTFKELTKLVNDELNKFFKPEFLNRFDELVIFEPLTEKDMLAIAKLGIENTKKMLKEQNIDLQISENGLAQLAKEGYDPVYGARPLRRLIQRSIENPIAIYLINKTIQPNDTVIIDYDLTQDKFTFNKAAAAPTTPAPAENQTPAAPQPNPPAPTQENTAPPPASPPPTEQAVPTETGLNIPNSNLPSNL
jgi:ATP-dependent Clp protease ATP-binding subunit ClpC